MNYKIVDIEGIGANYAEKLVAAGIKTTNALLKQCANLAGRKELAGKTGISSKLIVTWTNHADLMRIKGVGPQFAELLEAAGVDSIKELQHRIAANLQPKLVEINEKKHLTKRVPTLKEVESMVKQAKKLPAAVEY